MGINIADQASKITKSEYIALKKSQKKTRLIGAVLFVVGLILYPVFISLEMPFLVMPAGISEVTGLIMFIISFTHQKSFAFHSRDFPGRTPGKGHCPPGNKKHIRRAEKPKYFPEFRRGHYLPPHYIHVRNR